MIVFRTMAVDPTDGKPRTGTQPNQLGLRPADPTNPNKVADTTAAEPTALVAASEGLSTTPGDPHRMWPHLIRKSEQPGFALWALDTAALPSGLVYVPDGPTHGLIAPTAETPLGTVQSLLADTRDAWVRVEWDSLPVPPGNTP